LKQEANKIMSLPDSQFQQLVDSLKKSINGETFPPISSWPQFMKNLYTKDSFGDCDTLKSFSSFLAMDSHQASHSVSF